MTVTAFLSAVSDEFHHGAPETRFVSYRDVLARSLRILVNDSRVIVQEDLQQGMGDLLATLENEIQQAHVVVHLVGAMAGAVPEAASVRRLKERHLQFLEHEPELLDCLGDGANVSYTQWEAYLAFQHGCDRLVFVVDDAVPRSPRFRRDALQQASQQRHFERLQKTGEHYQPCFDQLDLARKAVAAIERFGLRHPSAERPTSKSIAIAKEVAPELATAIGTALRNAAKHASSELDPAGISVFLNAIDTATLQRELDRRTGLQAIHEHSQTMRDAARADPTPSNLYDLALAELAMGNYLEALLVVDRLATGQVRLMDAEAEHYEQHREGAINAYLLAFEAAQLAGRKDDAIRSLESACALVDIEQEPTFWADLHEPLAEYLLEHGDFDRAGPLIDEIVDIREEHQGENDPALPKSLLLWGSLLTVRAQYQGVVDVSTRAAKLFGQFSPPHTNGVASAFGFQSNALLALGRFAEAEPLMSRLVPILERLYGKTHPNVATALNNLASLFKETNRLAEAEPLMRRALAIDEQAYGKQHPKIATDLNVLAQLLQDTNRLSEAEPLMRRALAIDEQTYGTEHPTVATRLNNLAQLLQETNRLSEAEPLMRRALVIDELFYGTNHPVIARGLNNLALLLHDTNRLVEAESLMLRALEIDEQAYEKEHPDVARCLNNLASLYHATNRPAQAEPLVKRVVLIYEQSHGESHPNVALAINNLAQIYQAMGRFSEAEPLMRRALVIDEQSFGRDHPSVARDMNNLAELLKATDRLTEAEPLLRRALEIDEKSYGTEHPTVARDLNTLAQLLQATNRVADAESLFRRALAIDEQSYGTEHISVVRDMHNLAVLLKESDRLTEAESYLSRTIEICSKFGKATGHAHSHMQAALSNYFSLLRKTGVSETDAKAKIDAMLRGEA